ncbi:MAG: Ldh family oxidoreductase [Acholeplasma sp.]|nr:Ldh family oxidoreductase [Acholeplasma sp.]
MSNNKVSVKEITRFMELAFLKVGVCEKDAKVCAEVLVESDIRGIASHGINRFKAFYIDRILSHIQEPISRIEILKDTPTTAVIDGHNGMGMVIAKKAMEMAIIKAKQLGIGMVVVRNSTHYGIAGYYASMAVKHDLIGITGTNARPAIAPTFGVDNMLGTNPLTFGMPSDEAFPFMLDAATSTIQRGRIEYYAKNGIQTPVGLVIDQEGKSLTDSEKILKMLVQNQAALTPLGGAGEAHAGYKGYGYATVVEILSSALQSGSFLHLLSGIDQEGNPKPIPVGHFFIAINPSFFMGIDAFKRTTGDILRQLRNSKVSKGEERIYTAGEKEYLSSKKVLEEGILVTDAILKDLLEVKEKLQIAFEFSFERQDA